MDENEQKETMTEPAEAAEQMQEETKQEDEKNSQRASGCGKSAI